MLPSPLNSIELSCLSDGLLVGTLPIVFQSEGNMSYVAETFFPVTSKVSVVPVSIYSSAIVTSISELMPFDIAKFAALAVTSVVLDAIIVNG